MIAGKESYCDETGKKINIGEEIIFIPASKKLAKARSFCSTSKYYKAEINDIRTGHKV
jgi:hypothetical protein